MEDKTEQGLEEEVRGEILGRIKRALKETGKLADAEREVALTQKLVKMYKDMGWAIRNVVREYKINIIDVISGVQYQRRWSMDDKGEQVTPLGSKDDPNLEKEKKDFLKAMGRKE